ncbi:MAG: DnaD domain protein [Clostridia bacterium]|nr:DnaD domain protein [Clostridia bacterium]
MRYLFQFDSKVANLPSGVLREKLASCTEIELKLLCGLAADDALRDDYEENADAFAASIGCRREDLDRALDFWRGTGAVKREGERKKSRQARSCAETRPIYRGEELAEIIRDEGLNNVIDECAGILGISSLNYTDTNSIVSMMHHLGVDGTFVLMLSEYCARKGKCSLAYVTKTAYTLYDDGVDTAEKLEAYITARDSYLDMENRLRRMFGIGSRALTAKEKNCFEEWNDRGTDEEMIRMAYDVTVEKTGKYTVSYLEKVLRNWHDKGYKTAEDVERAEKEYAETKACQKGGSFDTDEFFEAALKRSRENTQKLRESENNNNER